MDYTPDADDDAEDGEDDVAAAHAKSLRCTTEKQKLS